MENKVKVVINNVEYTLVSADSEEYLREVARKVDEQMKQFSSSGAHVSALMSAVLTAVNFCDENTRLKEDVDNLRAQLKTYIDDVNKLRAQYMDAHKEASRLLSEVQNLKVELAKAQQNL